MKSLLANLDKKRLLHYLMLPSSWLLYVLYRYNKLFRFIMRGGNLSLSSDTELHILAVRLISIM